MTKTEDEKLKLDFSNQKVLHDFKSVYTSAKNRSFLQRTVFMLEIAGKGGIAHYTYNLCNSLSKYSNVCLVTAQDYELFGKNRKFQMMQVFNRFKTNPFFIFRLTRALRKEKYPILHIQLSQYPLFVLLIMFFLKYTVRGLLLVVTAHNIESHERRSLEKYVFLTIYNMASRIIVHANANKKELVALFAVQFGKVEVIPHGNYMFFLDESAPFSSPDRKKKNILFFGYIRKYKGLIFLLNALNEVVKTHPEVVLSIVGKPVEDFQVYNDTIKNYGLEKNIIKVLSYVPFEDVCHYFKDSDAVILPYQKIYQSGVLQLAYAFAKPVVVTNVGGLPECVDIGENGFIVEYEDVEALKDAIIQVLYSDQCCHMGEKSLELAKTKFSWGHISKKTEDMYCSLLEGNR
ncbi:glycosyltransferase family 4 protein [Desulfopila sp. IMCC35008]|uniref:glycosyltransferase family 4 protein n=1 Tax=Desulfopila sp. IMCC35008 TaxID=2653858 RepID=UPI0013D0BF5D|nr:glycosyltransferase family 4 protein [Desulfopila sp. IMCC35008]